MSWYSYFAIACTLYFFLLLFDSIGTIIPTRHLLGCFMCVQFFLGPMFAYNGLDQYQYFVYTMKIPEDQYFSYAIPAVLFFIIGLHINNFGNRGEKIDLEKVQKFTKRNLLMPYSFIVIGLFSSFLGAFFSSDFAFIFYLIGSFKFIGLFLLVLGNKNIPILPLILVISSIVYSSFLEGMFHDLITWVIYITSFFAIKYKFSYTTKIVGFSFFLILVITLQVLKGEYRETTGQNKDDAGFGTFAKLAQKKNEENQLFSFKNLAESNVRINQGFIITNIISTVPDKVEFANGSELYIILEAAILPRIIAPNKLNAGDRTLFTKYSGISLTKGTSMGLSTVGDAYINFGLFGGAIFMFFLGFFYSSILNYIFKSSLVYPILPVFAAMIFYYPIRPDCETQTILGHLIKSCFLIFIMFYLWSKKFRLN